MAGLVARSIEAAGIPTVAISISEAYTRKANPPRAAVVRFPFGHATGEKGNVAQQRRVVLEALKLLVEAEAPEIRKLTHLKWRRTDYAALEPILLDRVRADPGNHRR